jgi:hypothetical protein
VNAPYGYAILVATKNPGVFIFYSFPLFPSNHQYLQPSTLSGLRDQDEANTGLVDKNIALLSALLDGALVRDGGDEPVGALLHGLLILNSVDNEVRALLNGLLILNGVDDEVRAGAHLGVGDGAVLD